MSQRHKHCEGQFCFPPKGGWCSCDCWECVDTKDDAAEWREGWGSPGPYPTPAQQTRAMLEDRRSGAWLKALIVVLIIPWCLIGCGDGDDDSWTDAYEPHKAATWTVTTGGIVRDAGPFGSVAAGYTTDAEIDAAIDSGMTKFRACFPEYAHVRPGAVHITDDYVFWAGDTWASGYTEGDQVMVCLWARGESETEPAGACWIKREPPASDGRMVWRYTRVATVPALAHECLHLAIGDPMHKSPLWTRLK